MSTRGDWKVAAAVLGALLAGFAGASWGLRQYERRLTAEGHACYWRDRALDYERLAVKGVGGFSHVEEGE